MGVFVQWGIRMSYKSYHFHFCTIGKGFRFYLLKRYYVAVDNHAPRFSERYGYDRNKFIRIFGWRIEFGKIKGMKIGEYK